MLKAISIVLVLLWHLQPIRSDGIGADHDLAFIGRGVTIFYHYITLLAVPTFITVSVYLFMRKAPLTWVDLRKRLIHLGHIFLVWVLVQYLFCFLATGGVPPFSIDTIKVGGPDLPHVGGSVFYFLFLLFKITAISFLFMKLPETIRRILSVLALAASLLYFALSPFYGISIATVSTKNFYVCIPIAYCLLRYREILIRFRLIFLSGFIVSIGVEELFSQHMLSAYARPSILFGVLYFISAIHAYEFGKSRIVEWLSRYSLGIFALHKYWQFLFVVLMEMMRACAKDFFPMPAAENLLIFSLASALTFASVFALSRTRWKVYVG
jgi:hypothetical protein